MMDDAVRVAPALLPARLLLSLAALGLAGACSGDGTGPRENPVPVITAIEPSVVSAGGEAFTLAVTGSGFVEGSQIRWNGIARATLFESATRLTSPVLASHIAHGGLIEIGVWNPGPGGGESGVHELLIGYPVPAVTGLFPNSAPAGWPSPIDLQVNGSGFLPVSVVRWDGEVRTTEYVSPNQLRVTMPVSYLAAAGTPMVTVTNPGPGGGTTQPVPFTLFNPRPTIASLQPAQGRQGDADFTLRVNGTHFVQGATVRWNGAARPTTFASSGRLDAAISAADLAAHGVAEVTVANPEPAQALSNATSFFILPESMHSLWLEAGDLAYDPERGLIYASVRSTSLPHQNTVAAIDPMSGELRRTLHVGSNPGRLAISDDARYLYVSLDGEAAIRRVDLETFEADLRFTLGTGPMGPLHVEDMHVLPGRAGSIAVARRNVGVSPRHEGVAVYDDGVMRPVATERRTGSNVIAFGATADTLYGYNQETTEFGVRRMVVSDSGVVVISTHAGLLHVFGVAFRYDARRLYATNGAVIDVAAMRTIAMLPTGGHVYPESARGRVYFLETSLRRVSAFSTSTFTELTAYTIPGVT